MNDDIKKQVLSSIIEFRVSALSKSLKGLTNLYFCMCHVLSTIWRLCENLFPYQLPTLIPNP